MKKQPREPGSTTRLSPRRVQRTRGDKAERPFQLQALLHGSGFKAVCSINVVEIDEGKIEAGTKLVDHQDKTAPTLRFTGS